MRKTTLRQLEVLEREERSYQRKHQSAFETLAFLCWKVLLAHHLGDLEQDEQDPGEAEARALKYDSRYDYLEALFNGGIADINKRFMEAAHRLFGQVNLDFDRSSRRALSQAFVTLVNQLPEPWLQWIESNSQVSRNSRVFTQIGKAALPGVRISDHQREESKVCFWAFRRYSRPRMKVGWWQYEVANELQRFYQRLIKGERPKLVLMAPPQHGKTEQVKDFVAWVAGKNPDLKNIFASYSDDLGVAVNMDLQRIMTSERYVAIFGYRLGESGSRWARNSNVLEYANHCGSFYNTTVGGQITGKGLDIGIVDDPIKGRAEANSKTVREKVWYWFTDDFLTRFSDSAGLLMIMTRWHLDDPVGRLIERFPDAKILRYPAIAEEDEKNRLKGEALFPQHKSVLFLLERKTAMSQASWESEYQQHPIVVGGGMFPIEKLVTLAHLDRNQVVRSVRYIDKAGTEGGGAYTAMVLMHKLKNNTFVIEHVARGQWAALEREEHIKHWAAADKKLCRPGAYEIVVEQEPGSGGKESVEATIRMLVGYKVAADKVTGSKEVRADPFAAQVQGGNVKLVAGGWQYDFLDEMESFPSGKYRDQVDAASGAFNRLILGPSYSLWGGAFA
jgi:predicted phage terminase large subunit-like protein